MHSDLHFIRYVGHSRDVHLDIFFSDMDLGKGKNSCFQLYLGP